MTAGVRFTGADQIQEYILPPDYLHIGLLGTTTCQLYLELEPGETYKVEVWSLDVAGNESEVVTSSVEYGCGCQSSSAADASGACLVLTLGLRRRRRRA